MCKAGASRMMVGDARARADEVSRRHIDLALTRLTAVLALTVLIAVLGLLGRAVVTSADPQTVTTS
jgi:hypothetical protein